MYTPIIVPKKWERQEECIPRSQNIESTSHNSKFEGAFLILAMILVIMFALTIKENDSL